SNSERGRYYGWWSTAHSIGEGLTFLAVGTLVATYGWCAGYVGPALVCMLAAGWGHALVQDPPQTKGPPALAALRHDPAAPEKTAQTGSLWRAQSAILKTPAVWTLALSSALIYVTRYAINSWGVLYLQEVRGYSLPAAGSLLFISTCAGVVGAIAYGYISDKLF